MGKNKENEIKVKIQVTEGHIHNGARLCEKRNPVALAIRDVVVKGTFVRVGWDSIQIGKATYSITDELKKFLETYDWHKPVRPMNFGVELPVKILEKEEIPQ